MVGLIQVDIIGFIGDFDGDGEIGLILEGHWQRGDGRRGGCPLPLFKEFLLSDVINDRLSISKHTWVDGEVYLFIYFYCSLHGYTVNKNTVPLLKADDSSKGIAAQFFDARQREGQSAIEF